MATSEALQRIRRFRVENRDNVTVLVTGTDQRLEFPLRFGGIAVTLSGHVTYAGRSLSPHPFGSSRWLIFERPHISIGAAGDEGFTSVLADDSLFVVDGAHLKHLPVETIRVVELTELEHEESLQLSLQEKDTARSLPLGKHQAASTAQPDDQAPFGRGLLAHVSAAAKLWEESVELVIGIPEPQYSDLFDSCVTRRVDQIMIRCTFLAHTAAGQYETPRDVVLFTDQSVPVQVTDVSTGCTLGSSSAQLLRDLDQAPARADPDSHEA